MNYQQKYTDRELSDPAADIDTALEKLRHEIAENLMRVNNRFCEKKYPTVYDVFWGFPASGAYDDAIAGRFITVCYALDGANGRIKEQILSQLLELRIDLKNMMRKL